MLNKYSFSRDYTIRIVQNIHDFQMETLKIFLKNGKKIRIGKKFFKSKVKKEIYGPALSI